MENRLDALAAALRERTVVVVAGAGCSTGSGIPDYGGLHSKTRRTRIQFKDFMSTPGARKRYWARAAIGWRKVGDARPNRAHLALADLEAGGRAQGLITQNVDGLHQAAGNETVVELHGSLGRVRCLSCDAVEPRDRLQIRILASNPDIEGRIAPFAPDGDSEVDDRTIHSFVVPVCESCGGVLKPDVVFFGETVPADTLASAWEVYESSDAVLVVGSSLAVFSGYRFVLRAIKDKKPVYILNNGETRADQVADLKIEGRLEDLLPELAERLTSVV